MGNPAHLPVSPPDIYRDCFYNAVISRGVLLSLLQISPNARCSRRSPISNHILQAALAVLKSLPQLTRFLCNYRAAVSNSSRNSALFLSKASHTALNPGLTVFLTHVSHFRTLGYKALLTLNYIPKWYNMKLKCWNILAGLKGTNLRFSTRSQTFHLTLYLSSLVNIK